MQRLMPPHTDIHSSDSEACACCEPGSEAWSRLVPFEERARSSDQGHAGAASSSASMASTSYGRSSDPCKQGPNNQQSIRTAGNSTRTPGCNAQPRVPVAIAIEALLRLQLRLVFLLSVWLEAAGQAVARGDVTDAHLRERIGRLLKLADQQLLLEFSPHGKLRVVVPPYALLGQYCWGTVGQYGRLGCVLRQPVIWSLGSQTRTCWPA